jgi:hypothetical protein
MRNQNKSRGLQTTADSRPSQRLRFLSIIGLIVDDFFADVAALVAERVWHSTPVCCQLKKRCMGAWSGGRRTLPRREETPVCSHSRRSVVINAGTDKVQRC